MSVAERQEVTFTRKEFYDKLWSMPTTKIAAELGCSDVMIGKVCKAFDIPKPYAGYWAKLAHGKNPRRTRLPKNDDPGSQTLTFFKCPHQESTCNEPPRELQYDADVRAILERARELGPVKVADTLRNAHPLVAATKAELETREADSRLPWDRQRHIEPESTLAISVTKGTRKRALLIMDGLIKRVEKIGGRVEVRPSRHRGYTSSTVVVIADEDATTLRLRERCNMVRIKNDKAEYSWEREHTDLVPNGLLLFETGPSSYGPPLLQDTKTRKLEDRLAEFVVRLVVQVGESRIRRREEQEAARRREEQSRIAREAAEDLRRRQEELRQLQVAEQAKVDTLFANARAWKQSQAAREYLDCICQQSLSHDGSLPIDDEIARYLRWGFQQADRLDPLAKSPHSVLDEKIDPETGSRVTARQNER